MIRNWQILQQQTHLTVIMIRALIQTFFYVTYQQEQFVEETLTIIVGDGTITQGTVKQRLLHILHNIIQDTLAAIHCMI